MKAWMLLAMGGLSSAAMAQQAQEITFFSNPGFGGARYTVTGPRAILDIPFRARSAVLQGGGSWEICPRRNYGGNCERIARSERDLAPRLARPGSIRPVEAVTSTWREIARLSVRDRAERDTVPVRDRERYRAIMICSERNLIRIRRAEAQLDNGRWQRLFVPLALPQGQCSNAIDLLGTGPRVRAVRFEYESWTLGMAGGTITVRALPYVAIQPR